MDATSQVRNQRIELGLTQVELAAQAQIALPTLQQLEGGASNPSLDTLEKLGRVLGFAVELRKRSCDWDRLIELGLPLMSSAVCSKRESVLSSEDLVSELRCALTEIEADSDERKREALCALLLALSTHFPSFYKRHFKKNQKANALAKMGTGRVIKLRRLALAKISEYL